MKEYLIEIHTVKDNFSSYILINLNSVIKDLFVKGEVDAVINPSVNLTNEERKIVLLLRKDKFKEVRIIFNNGKADLFTGMQLLNIDKRVFEMLKEHKYQEIKIVQDNGKVVSLKRTIKQKITD